ncbi:hypothetical protein GCM10009117_23460 [Gangjinia marincola]|uniref:Secretion system C-terminal sorting domain-containing protein n=2 Tax=Gangjinia marincola TaxID=578463 RepID=A0ABP3XUX0_9FLAO
MFGIAQAQSISQAVIGNSGTTLSNASTELNFTLGEPVVGNVSNATSVGQGFWNGAIAEITLSNDDFELINSTSVYPNPVIDRITITFEEMNNQTFELKLSDINGKQLLDESFENTMGRKEIDLSAFSGGIYFLRISNQGSQSSKTIKLIKQ